MRVTPGVEVHTHEFVRTGQEDTKFGFSVASGAAAAAVAALERSPGVELVGRPRPHRQPGLRRGHFEQAAEVLGAFFAPLGLPELVVGGGLGVAYVNGETRPPHGRVGARPPARPARRPGSTRPPGSRAEPGRSIVATAGVTLYRWAR